MQRLGLRLSDFFERWFPDAFALDLNHYVFAFLIAVVLLHWRPRSFVQAIAAGVQFVVYVPVVLLVVWLLNYTL